MNVLDKSKYVLAKFSFENQVNSKCIISQTGKGPTAFIVLFRDPFYVTF